MSKTKNAPPEVAANNPLARLRTLQAFQAANAAMFPSLDSLRWYVRRNRTVLVQAGALLEITGRIWVDPEQFAAATLALGVMAQ